MEISATNPTVNPAETVLPPTQNTINNQRGFFPVVLGVIILLIVVGGGAYYLGTKNNQVSQQPSSSTSNKNTPTPEPTQTTNQIVVNDPTPQPGSSARKINYARIGGWSDFSSNTGYSIQHPPAFTDNDNSGEVWRDGSCRMFFDNNAGGILSSTVSPYNGGSRRQLYGTPPGYTYQYEEVVIQGRNSLLIETGPIGDSGSGTGVVIPVGNTALILSWSNRAKNDPDVTKLLQSVKINNSLDLSKCKQTTDEAKFTGTITAFDYGCHNLDGTCRVKVDEEWVTAQIGGNPANFPQYGVYGQLIGISLTQSEKDSFMGKRVEVYGKMSDVNNYTIYGSKNFYIKLLN